ncbi:MAG TPA: FHA domain-containing serine/threonine-protein kinase [Verrucomicrobiae bacterium]|nr:FHA domain-containing serine/threonine-protein kinase [Verrucomicrobiae bacterium]
MLTKVQLIVSEGAAAGKRFVFDEHDTLILGRETDCHIQMPEGDPAVSRHHFILEVDPPDMMLRDLGSMNGTWVNDEKQGGREKGETPEQGARRKHPEVELRHGDKIKVGNTVLTVAVDRPPPPKGSPKPRAQTCLRCGKDVAVEVAGRQEGAYVCKDCRKTAEHDPAALLANLIARAVKGGAAGPSITGYDFVRRLGTGGFGAVYEARDKRSKQPVAIKIMLSRVAVEKRGREIFEREVSLMRDMRHPHIVGFLDHGCEGTAFYFIMELCDGNLADLIKRSGGRIPLKEAVPIMRDSLKGLEYAHSRGFIHRDLKPHNILLARASGRTIAKVADFGLAKSFIKAGLSGMTVTGSFAGTVEFMPREQISNFKYLKPVSDVWSIGATFYMMLCGQLPREFPAGHDRVRAVLQNPTIPLSKQQPGLPKALTAAIDRALSDRIDERYPSAVEFSRAIEAAL